MSAKTMSVLMTLALAVAGCVEEAEKDQQEIAEALLQDKGASLFQQNCSRCHERAGRGDYLSKIPATVLSRRSPAELKQWIKGSGEHRQMPDFDNLDEEQLTALSAYLHSQISR